MVENGFFYKVLCVKVGLFYSEIIDEQNFGSQQEAAEFAKGIDPAKLDVNLQRNETSSIRKNIYFEKIQHTCTSPEYWK